MVLLQKSKTIKEENATTQILLGDAFLIENNGSYSASAYERATDLEPGSALPWFKLGELFMRSKNVPMVEEKLQKAVSVDPDYALAHRELGEMYYLKKDGVNAAKHYKKYLDLTDSPDKDDRTRLAFFYFMAKDYDNSNKEFKDICSKPDASATALKFYTQSLVKSGNYAEAENIFNLYLKHPQTKVEADDWSNLGDMQIKQGKDSLASISYEKSVVLDQNQPDVLQTLIDYYFKKKKYEQCIVACRTMIKIRKTPNPRDYFNMGRSFYLSKNYPPADSAFAKLIELQPKITLGYLWAARSKSAQDCAFDDKKCKVEWLAKPYYEKVIEVGEPTKDKNKNDLIEAYRYLVGHYLSKQDFAKGKEILNKILEVNPDDADAKEALKDINNPQPQKPKKK
ncbi:MAG: tetratricopeptide repeat protein [Cyclobacteriaceae bacterium]